MGTITSANVANAIVKLVAVDALPALVGNLVMGNLVNRDYEPTLANAGDTVNVPIPPTLVANNIAEGGTVQTQNPNLGNAQIVLNTHAEATFQIPDVTKVLAVPDLLKLYMQPAVVAIAERIESDILNLYSQFSANTAVGTAGIALTEAVVDQAETALFQAKVPAVASKYLVVDPVSYSAMRQIPRFSEYYSAGDAGLAGAGGRCGREDQGLLRISIPTGAEDGQRASKYAQSSIREGRDWTGDSQTSAAPARNGRDRRIRGDGQLRNPGGDELSAEYAGTTIHGGRPVRNSGSSKHFWSAG